MELLLIGSNLQLSSKDMYCHSTVQVQHQYASLSVCFAGIMSKFNIFVRENIRLVVIFHIFWSFGTVGFGNFIPQPGAGV